ncbi:MAG: hypothetical protein IJ391_04695 [Clostridia bacterium]|nr:hypothetical protein [Clostridia bacterium]
MVKRKLFCTFLHFIYLLAFVAAVDLLIFFASRNGRVPWVIFAVPVLIPVFFLQRGICRSLSEMYIIKKGDFSIVSAVLSDIGELEAKKSIYFINKLIAKAKRVDVLYYSPYKRYIVSDCEKELLKYSAPGDTFYIVVFNNNKNIPVVVYNARAFNFTEG